MGKKLDHKEGIYMILSLIDNKKYIGEAVSIYKRWWSHRMNLRFNRHSNQYLQNAWNKYGKDNFIFHIVEVLKDSTKQSRLEREKYWTNYYNTENQNFGYNFANVHSEDSLNKKKAKVERKQRIYKKIYQLSKEDNSVIKIWNRVKDVCDFLDIKEKSFLKHVWSLNKRVFTYKGFIWVREKDYKENFDYRVEVNKLPPKPKKEKPPKIYKTAEEYNIKRNPISLQNIKTGEVRHFKSHAEAIQALKFSPGTINNLIKGYKSKGGGKVVKISQWKGWKILN